jgi:transcriptional regulator with XRE-family HTH domain
VEIQKKFGQKLQKLRQEKGLSQEKFANLAELDRTYIPSIEKGERNISLAVIYKLNKALGITISDFFEGL